MNVRGRLGDGAWLVLLGVLVVALVVPGFTAGRKVWDRVQDPYGACRTGDTPRFQSCVEETFRDKATATDLLPAVRELDASAIDRRALLSVCHAAMHHFANNGAAPPTKELLQVAEGAGECGQGLVHGYLARQLDAGASMPQMVQLCRSMDDGDLATCFHGLGHGAFRQVSGDVRAAATQCEAAGDGRSHCLDGALMELGFTSKPTTARAAVAPCRQFDVGVRSEREVARSCYQLAYGRLQLALGVDAVPDAVARDLCATAPGAMQETCTEGIGHEIVTEYAGVCDELRDVGAAGVRACWTGSIVRQHADERSWDELAEACRTARSSGCTKALVQARA